MESLLLIALFAPLVGFGLLVCLSGSVSRFFAGFIGCTAVLVSLAIFASFLVIEAQGLAEVNVKGFEWIKVPGIDSTASLRLDHLALVMALIITGVGFLIHVYSNGYMENDANCARFFALMNFFIFSMLLLVLADNLLLMFVGWEGVGLASYLLIGFWYEHTDAPPAATKAFVVNRIGDLGFLLGVILTFYAFTTSDINTVSQKASQGSPSVITAITLLLFIGAVGKSAQLPLYTWLPDAMAGPTPVSALIHAATMVTAGVYLVVRMHPLFLMAPITLNVIGIVGGATALFAALCAVGQTDLKRVLAFSTVSQLGYMFLACGVGAFYSAIFHLMTHAFMKALLFLSAGNVVHMLHDVTQMGKMGGLAKRLPLTAICFLIGVLAMSGIPPLAAFFSKDLILEMEYASGYAVLFFIGLIAAVITAFYLTRAFCLTFMGESRMDKGIFDHLREAPKVMLIPVAILAFLAAVGGFLGFGFGVIPHLESFLSQLAISVNERELSTHFDLSWEMVLAVFGAIAGIGAAVYVYKQLGPNFINSGKTLLEGFYIDKIYDTLITQPLYMLAGWFAWIFETDIVNGIVRWITGAVNGVSKGLHPLQSGQSRSYAAWMIAGAVALMVYLVL